jgi:flagellar biosynthetic protein FliR
MAAGPAMSLISELSGFSQEQLLAYLQTSGLGFARILTAISIVPFFGGKIVRARIKMSIATAIFLLLAPAILPPAGVPPPAANVFSFTFLLAKEIFIGLIMGWLAGLIFHIVEASGRFLDLARGASMAQMFTPQLGAQVSLFGQLYVQMTIVIFFAIGGHQYFLHGLGKSFLLLPVDQYPVLQGQLGSVADTCIRVSAQLFTIALQLAAPAAAATFIADVFLGIANKVAPQVQVFFLGMPIKAMLGILMIFIVLALWKTEVARHTVSGLQEMMRTVHMMVPR